MLKLGEFPLFDGFFDFSLFDLGNFWDLANFWFFDLPIFGFTYFNLSPFQMPPISLAASTLVPSTLLAAKTCDDMVVFSIEVSDTAILLKLLMNQQ